jgi:HEAT repeat protein
VILAVATTLALSLPGAALRVPPDVAGVWALLESDAAGPERDVSELADELTRLGFVQAPDLFQTLAMGGPDGRSLSAREDEALVTALASFGAAPVRALLGARLDHEPPVEVRHAALLLLARLGTGEDVPLLRRAAAGGVHGLAPALQSATAGILRRDEQALHELGFWIGEAQLDVAKALARGIGDSARPEALAPLVDQLGYREELDLELLPQIGRIAERAPQPLDETLLDELRTVLEDAAEEDDAALLRAVVLALGRARDSDAVPLLIPLLPHETRGVRDAALWALERVSDLRLGADTARWNAWLRAETDWYAERSHALRDELRSPADEVAIRALGELSGHGLHRHRLAQDAALALEHESPRVRRLACVVLTRLKSSAGAEALQNAAEDEDESVSRAAARALASLEGGSAPSLGGAARALKAPPTDLRREDP